VLDRLRRSEYTGANRCVPCTLLNVLLAAVGAVLLAVFAADVLAVGFLLAALSVIYLRGYLVPGTPALTRRYLPASVLARFGKDPNAQPDQSWDVLEKMVYERENAVEPEAYLRDAGVIETSDDGDLRFTDAFAADVARAEVRHRDDPENVAVLEVMFETAPDDISFEERDHPAIQVGPRVRTWPSEAALLADVATHEALTEWTGVRPNRVRPGSGEEGSESAGVRPNRVRPGSGEEGSESAGVRPNRVRPGSSDERSESDGVGPNRVRPGSSDERSESDGVGPNRVRPGSSDEQSESDGDGMDAWLDVPVDQRQSILESLREVRETCPVCGGRVGRSGEPVESCCWSGEVLTVTCTDCGVRVHEFGRLDHADEPVF